MDITFTSQEQLYERVKPALYTKQAEMQRAGYGYIRCEDIWNYLKECKWKTATNLSLGDMVNDILNSEDIFIDDYLKTKLNLQERNIYFKENEEKENEEKK